MRLAAERPDWLPVVQAALACSRSADRFGGEFAGAWVLQKLRTEGGIQWLPNLRMLAGFRIVEKSGDSTRGGQRAYYRIPDPTGVSTALKALGHAG